MTNADLCAVEDKILVVPDEAEEVTKGGIVLPEVSKERPCRGTVISVGPGATIAMTGLRAPMPVDVGDSVYFTRFGGSELQLPDEPKVLVLRPEHLVARVRKNGAL